MIGNINAILGPGSQIKGFVRYKSKWFIEDPDTIKQQLIEMVNKSIDLWKGYLADLLEEDLKNKQNADTGKKKRLIEGFIRELEAFKIKKFNKTGGNGDDN